jgi:hypothetical protein
MDFFADVAIKVFVHEQGRFFVEGKATVQQELGFEFF